MSKNVLVVAAHPDDEVLGCGGSMAKHSREGDAVHVLILAEGITSRRTSRKTSQDAKALKALRHASQRANAHLHVKSLTLENLPDNRMDSVDFLDVVKIVERHVERVRPGIVYTHHGGDLNIDHRLTHEAVLTACRPMPGSHVSRILFFEVASSTEWQVPNARSWFEPNWYQDISETLDAKMKALQSYEHEMRAWPHARSIKGLEHLARWRGSNVGVQAAEAFMLGRQIQR